MRAPEAKKSPDLPCRVPGWMLSRNGNRACGGLARGWPAAGPERVKLVRLPVAEGRMATGG